VKVGEKGEGSEGKGREKRGSDGDRRIEREMIELREGLRRDKRDCLSEMKMKRMNGCEKVEKD